MKYKIIHGNTVLDEVSGKQALYARWYKLFDDLKKKGTFDWTVGFSMGLKDQTEITVKDIHGKVPGYNRNEWKNL